MQSSNTLRWRSICVIGVVSLIPISVSGQANQHPMTKMSTVIYGGHS